MQSGTIRADDHGLEDPFKDARTLAPPNGRAQAPLQHLMQQQPEQKLGKFQTNSHQPQSFSLIDDDWVQPPMPQRSQSVTHAEMQELQVTCSHAHVVLQANAIAVAEARFHLQDAVP